MPPAQVKRCPQCKNDFQPRRKNQDYCSTECRTDFNNAAAKVKYTTFKKQAPRISAIEQELKRLEQYLASLTIVIQGIEQLDRDRIKYQGKTYRYHSQSVGVLEGVTLDRGGAVLLPNGDIMFGGHYTLVALNTGRYVREK